MIIGDGDHEGGGRRLTMGILQKPTGKGGGEEDANAGGLDEVEGGEDGSVAVQAQVREDGGVPIKLLEI